MSTTFDVIPASRANVRFGEIFELAQGHISSFLGDLGIEKHIELRAELISETARRDVTYDEFFEWPQETYTWITVRNVPGGTDAYCDAIKDGDDLDEPWWFLNELKSAPNYSPEFDERLLAARNHDRRWSFRRSAGQPVIINIAYGLIAASLAELTDGLIYSGDSAWDYQIFPATSPEFRKVYFRPEQANEPDKADWAERCLASLRDGIF